MGPGLFRNLPADLRHKKCLPGNRGGKPQNGSSPSWKRLAGDAIPVRVQAVGILRGPPCRFIECLRFALGAKIGTVSIRALGIIGDMIRFSIANHGVPGFPRRLIFLTPLIRVIPVTRHISGAFPYPEPSLPRKPLRFLKGIEMTARLVDIPYSGEPLFQQLLLYVYTVSEDVGQH